MKIHEANYAKDSYLTPDGINNWLGTFGSGMVAEPIEGAQYDTNFVQSMEASEAIAIDIGHGEDPDVKFLRAEIEDYHALEASASIRPSSIAIKALKYLASRLGSINT